MAGSATTQAPRTLLREPLYFRCTIIVTPTLDLDQLQIFRLRGAVFSGRAAPEDCRSVWIETADEILIVYHDEVEGLGLAED